jgi:hypothetical protein
MSSIVSNFNPIVQWSVLKMIFHLTLFILVCILVNRVSSISSRVNTLLKNDWLVTIDVPFNLADSTEMVKSFHLPANSFIFNSNGFFTMSPNVTFPSGTTLTFKAATTMALLNSSPDIQSSEQLEIFGTGPYTTSGTVIEQYNSVNTAIENNPLQYGVTIYISLKLNHAPLDGPLLLNFVGNYADIAFEAGL